MKPPGPPRPGRASWRCKAPAPRPRRHCARLSRALPVPEACSLHAPPTTSSISPDRGWSATRCDIAAGRAAGTSTALVGTVGRRRAAGHAMCRDRTAHVLLPHVLSFAAQTVVLPGAGHERSPIRTIHRSRVRLATACRGVAASTSATIPVSTAQKATPDSVRADRPGPASISRAAVSLATGAPTLWNGTVRPPGSRTVRASGREREPVKPTTSASTVSVWRTFRQIRDARYVPAACLATTPSTP